jgi:hypothetical protein
MTRRLLRSLIVSMLALASFALIVWAFKYFTVVHGG